jgi:hypothetical protein
MHAQSFLNPAGTERNTVASVGVDLAYGGGAGTRMAVEGNYCPVENQCVREFHWEWCDELGCRRPLTAQGEEETRRNIVRVNGYFSVGNHDVTNTMFTVWPAGNRIIVHPGTFIHAFFQDAPILRGNTMEYMRERNGELKLCHYGETTRTGGDLVVDGNLIVTGEINPE